MVRQSTKQADPLLQLARGTSSRKEYPWLELQGGFFMSYEKAHLQWRRMLCFLGRALGLHRWWDYSAGRSAPSRIRFKKLRRDHTWGLDPLGKTVYVVLSVLAIAFSRRPKKARRSLSDWITAQPLFFRCLRRRVSLGVVRSLVNMWTSSGNMPTAKPLMWRKGIESTSCQIAVCLLYYFI